ncbi:hypothetical protein [Streptomyces sp. NPDC059564]|uniref:hypothetical protein n=1 Tax=Streptomyces sp. NPDC059564 TaxID=3346865 RepID=UPI0036BA3FCF
MTDSTYQSRHLPGMGCGPASGPIVLTLAFSRRSAVDEARPALGTTNGPTGGAARLNAIPVAKAEAGKEA